ncbi:Katanin p80 WD40 repeat-containing subunit B1-like protein [Vigna angularis]|uniref:Katanin p80 WD40 repeat-containing subunit B1-like protein n=1 Tax=Phaseolus angularis TaxID=3914 RepID=A0A8T0LDB2_PHAAN|nr:Katanin p80 WD40 repeat-containing subunit B1-like protein [Vigna angularis]
MKTELYDLKRAGGEKGKKVLESKLNFKPESSLCGHTTTVESVTFDSAEILVLSGASSGVIKLWDLQEAKNGRWVVSGGFDNVVKVWDLTGGKLLHDFKFHEGHIRSLDFHPLEFLLATGSADRTVKFWDLETFELIGSSRHEVSGVWSLTFHPDGRTLFTGLEDSLKVYSWEPVICHDAVDMGWTTLGDLCIHDEKLLGCSFYSNSVGVWVSDISLIKPYGDGLETENKESTEQKLTSEGNPDHLLRSRSYNSPKMDHLEESKEMLNLSSATRVRAKSNEQTLRKSYIVSNVVPLDILNDIDFREFVDTIRNSDSATDPNFEMNEVRDSIDDKHPIESVAEKFEKTLTPDGFSEQEKCNQSSSYSNAINPVKYANGVAVVQGRTRSLVKRFERKEITPTKEDQDNATPTTTVENREIFLKEDQTNASPITTTSTSEKGEIIPFSEDKKNMPTVPNTTSETDRHINFMDARLEMHVSVAYFSPSDMFSGKERKLFKAEFGRDSNPANDGEIIEDLLQTHDVTLSNLRSRLTKLQVVRHFWERNDTKGAINALEKLPDQSVQADVISVLVVKMEILTLDLFSCLLPVLTGLLDSKTERHVKVSLDMLLKLVVVFGPTIRSTISAPPSVGVDLHAEQRRECSNQCFMQLQKIRMILPILVRRGGVLAKTAQELNLVLQQP